MKEFQISLIFRIGTKFPFDNGDREEDCLFNLPIKAQASSEV